jgi:hypothetical protein
MNEEFPVSVSHQLALITSLPFVHTARRYYRLNDLVRYLDWVLQGFGICFIRKENQTESFRGSKSRNKVSVGEPAEGSFRFKYSLNHSCIPCENEQNVDVQLRTMDHLARIAMKNAANCVKYGELQGSRNRYMSNAYCGPVIYLAGPRLSEGLMIATSLIVCAVF